MRKIMVPILAPSLTRCVTSTESLNFPEPPISSSVKGNNDNNDRVIVRINNKNVYEGH